MKSQLFIIGAVIIVIFLVMIYSYISLSDYSIHLVKPIEINWNWESFNPLRLIYVISPSYHLYLNLSLPNATINTSTIIVVDGYPRKWQIDGNQLIVDDYGIPVQKNIFVYFSNSSGESFKFNIIPVVGGDYVLEDYNIKNESDGIIINGGEMNITCNLCSAIRGPVFVKFENGSNSLYAFDKFIKTNFNLINVSADNLTIGGSVYNCGPLSVEDKYVIFNDGNEHFEFANLTGKINCTNNIWRINLTKPTNVLISREVDEYGYRFFDKYKYDLYLESATEYFNKILSKYSTISSGVFECGKKKYGLFNNFGDLIVGNNYSENSFFYWNFSTFIFDGKNIQNGDIKLNGQVMDYKKISNNEIVGNASCGNITFEFFNMSPVVYFELESNSICNLTLPIGIGTYNREGNFYFVKNDSYVVEFVGDILENTSLPYIILRPNATFYMIILKDERDLFYPYHYELGSLCPKV